MKRSDLKPVQKALRDAASLINLLTRENAVDETMTDVSLDSFALLRNVPEGGAPAPDSHQREAVAQVMREIREAIAIIEPVLPPSPT